MIGAQQVLDEIFVALAGGAQQVGAPYKQVAHPVFRCIRILAGHFQFAGLQLFSHIFGNRLSGLLGGFAHFQRVGFQLGCRWQPAHAFGADVIVNQAGIPIALGRCG